MVRQVRLLGEVSAVTDHGDPAGVGPPKCQLLLAALALSAGTAVPEWRLAELVWGPEPPRTAGRTLQSYAARLRKALGPGSVARAGAAYRLEVTAEAVDVLRFQRRLETGDVGAALAEWTGLPFAGLDAPGLAAAAAGLTEQWLAAVEADLANRVEAVDPAGRLAGAPSVIGRLTELTAAHPYRERLWELLMTALYRAGRQSDALTAYRTARQQLIEHLGVEPGPALRELEARVLGQDERLLGESRYAPHRPAGTVTFGFCEVADAGRWWTSRPAEMAAAMARHDALVRGCADRHDGYLFASGGDSFGAAFHRAADAVAWAADLHAAVRAEVWPGGIAIRLSVGLHTGETGLISTGPAGTGPTWTAAAEQGYYGPAVNVAARLAAAGHGGQTLVSGTTSDLTSQAGLTGLGTYQLEGVVGEQRVYQAGRDEFPPPRTEDSRRGNLPRRLGRLVGRDGLLAAVGDALAAAPAVTLTGPGGIGKTRLALAAAARRADPDGVWLVELAEITSPDDVPRAVASVLGVKENPGQRLTESVVTALRARRALLVLDNCEHVIDAAAGLGQAVVTGCPGVQVLATSREALGLGQGHEHIVAVTPLDPAGPGTELFLERAAAAGVDLRADRTAVAEICRRLDGVPLAIELAAARTTSLAPADLLTRLDDQLRLLTGGPRTGAARHRTLRAAITWSYDLLSPAEQRLLRQLSVFTGPFGPAAAVAVAEGADGAGAADDVDELLGSLVTRSMLIAESGSFGRRFRLLETMRQFAAGRLAEAGDTAPAAARHARWCLDEVTSIRGLLAGQAEAEGVARLDELWPNLRTAFDWACAAGDRDFARALVRCVVVEVNRRSRNEVGDWIERMLALAPPGEDLVVFGLTWAAERYKLNQDGDAYERLVRRYGEPDHPLVHRARSAVHEDYEGLAKWSAPAVAALRERGDDDLADQLELDVAGGLLMTGDFAGSDAIGTALAGRYRAQGPPTLLNLTLVMLGYSASLRGEHDRAAALFDDAVRVEVPTRTHSPNQAVAARAVFRRGDRARGFAMLGAYVQQLLDDGNMQAACVSSLEFVSMTAAEGRLLEAATMLGYLETTGLLDGPAWRSLVEPAMRAIGTGFGPENARGRSLPDREALEYMLGILSGP